MKRNCAILAVLVCICVFCLGACGRPAPAPTPSPEPTVEPTPSPEPTPEPTPEPSMTPAPEPQEDPLYAPYRELVDFLTEGVRDGWTHVSLEGVGVSEVFGRLDRKTLGWLQRDINSDGVDELLFGEPGEPDAPSPIFDLYTLLNGELIHPICGWDFNRWYVTDSGILIDEISSTGFDSYYVAYGFFNGKLVEGFRALDRSTYLHLEFTPFAETEP